MNIIEVTTTAQSGATSQKVAIAIAGTSVLSAAIGATSCLVTCDAACFFRKSASANATNDGTDQYMAPNRPYRIVGLTATDKLAFNAATGTPNIFITPGEVTTV